MARTLAFCRDWQSHLHPDCKSASFFYTPPLSRSPARKPESTPECASATFDTISAFLDKSLSDRTLLVNTLSSVHPDNPILPALPRSYPVSTTILSAASAKFAQMLRRDGPFLENQSQEFTINLSDTFDHLAFHLLLGFVYHVDFQRAWLWVREERLCVCSGQSEFESEACTLQRMILLADEHDFLIARQACVCQLTKLQLTIDECEGILAFPDPIHMLPEFKALLCKVSLTLITRFEDFDAEWCSDDAMRLSFPAALVTHAKTC